MSAIHQSSWNLHRIGKIRLAHDGQEYISQTTEITYMKRFCTVM